MTNTDSSNRFIKGLSPSTDSSNLVPSSDLISNRLLFSGTYDNDSLILNLPVSISLHEGTTLWIHQLANTDYNTFVSIDAINYFPLININSQNDINCIKQNELELLVYNGTQFQEMFEGFKTCPVGFIDVNTEYCIQQNENTSANYWNAIGFCEGYNAKLCSWGEWYYACQNSGLGLSNMTNNWEWTESASNHATAVLILGNGNCKTAGESNTQVVTLNKYRCCYRKK